MIQLLDKLVDEKQKQVMIVKMDIYTYENLIKIDNDGFSKEAIEDLERELDEIEKGIDISKPYFDVNTLISDLRNNAIKY
jgi:hypothetical protein